MMKKQIYNYFYYTRRERNGAIVLATLCLLISFIPRLYPLLQKPKAADYTAFKTAIANWETKQIADQDSLFHFDPNTASESDLKRLGIPHKTVHILLNYREKGGHFYQKEDLKKIYGFPESLYHQLVSYIKIDSQKGNKPIFKASTKPWVKQAQKKQTASTLTIDINQANEDDWKQLRGIGPVLSKRIVKFRDKLGGFFTIDQVAETYGLADSTFQTIKSQLILSSILDKILVNQIDAASLQKHPYLDWRQAKAIVSYRDLHGPYGDIEDLKKLHLLSTELCEKLNPYLEY